MATVFVNWYLSTTSPFLPGAVSIFVIFLLAVFCIYMKFVVGFVVNRCFHIRDMFPSILRVSLDLTVSAPLALISLHNFVDRGVYFSTVSVLYFLQQLGHSLR